LVSSGIGKPECLADAPKFAPVMNPKSRELTKSAAPDLFEQSVDVQERQRRRAEEIKRWQDLADVTAFSALSGPRRRAISSGKKREISGMDDFLEQMSRKQGRQDDPPAPSSIRTRAIVVNPFSFENQPQKTQQTRERDVAAVLSEIDLLFVG
jgi:hypothetical protein